MSLEILAQIPFFGGLPRGELIYLASALRVRLYQPGQVLFSEGEPGDTFYIVIDGHLEVVLGLDTPDEKVLAVLGAGEYIGEMSLLMPGGLRSATVRIKTQARLWEMTGSDFESLLARQPHLVNTVIRVLGQRLSRTNYDAYNDLLEKNRELQRAYDELKAAQQQIIEKERLEKELQLAADIQMSILPRHLPACPGFDFGAFVDPARAVGGDFYDLFSLDAHNVGVLIGDVADKGAPSAIFMARSHALITAEALRGGAPAEVIHTVNEYLTKKEQNNLFVTVIYGRLDCETGEFTYVRAGHELPLLLLPDGQVTTLPKQGGMAIGMFDEIMLTEQKVTIPPGGTLLLFTDGMVDCRSPQGQPFGHDQLNRVFAGLEGLSAQQVSDGLHAHLLDYQQGAPQDDDVTVVVIHRQ